jgi:predicted metallopeptidase
MTLTLYPSYNVTDAKTICASELPYTWNGVEFTQAGSQTVTLETVYGCDSVVNMTLNVNPIYNVTDEQSICESELPYTWNEVVFTQAGTQTATLETVNGCDSVVTMTLTVNPIYNVTDAQTICDNELPYTWNDVVFTQAGTQTATLETVNGCDSVVVMTLTVNPTATATDARTICASELPYTWNGVTFTQAGTQVAHLQTVTSCDSAVTMTLTVNPTYTVTDTKTICASELPYTWNEVVFTQAGSQTVTLETVNGCDSVVTMTLTVNPIYAVTDTKTICASELPYTWNEVVFTQAGTQTATLETVNGCDSVVTMTLTVNPIYNVTDAQTICASELPYTWNEVVFTQAGTQTATLQTENGCDSVVVMTLTVNPTATASDAQTICASELPYTWNGVTFTQAGTQVAHLQTVNGCDSAVTMTLTVNPTYEVTDVKTICASELPYTWNGVAFTQAGTQIAHLQTVNGCDSAVTMTLNVNPVYNVTEEQSICESELPYTWNGIVFTQAGSQTVTLQTVNGCDSVVTMTLTVNQPTTGVDVQEACDSFTWIDGVTYTESTSATNAPTYVLTNAAGCDSVVTLDLTINHSVTVEYSLVISEDDPPYTIGDTTFDPSTIQSGDYTFYLTTAAGCDSIIILHLTVTGVEDYLMSVNMNVYPNPTTDKINIQISTMNHEQLLGTEIQLYDMYGKWLSTWKVTGETTEIDLSSYAASVYFIKAVNGKRQVGVRKIVKQ